MSRRRGVLVRGPVCCGLALVAAGCDAPPAVAPRPATESADAELPSEDRPPAPRRPNPSSPTSQTSPPSGTLDRTFDDLKFDIEPDGDFDRSLLTDPIRGLAGRRLRLRGYILPTAQKRGVKQFVLVRDNQECCFGPGAALYDCVLVTMRPPATAEFSVRPVAVEGTFAIEEFPGPDGRPLAIYRMEGERVE